MMNKKGIIRIIEAAMAVFILMAFAFIFFTSNLQRPSASESAIKIEHQILSEISNNYSLRQEVLGGKLVEVNKTVEKRLSAFALNFSVAACKPEESCLCSNCPGDREVFADEIIISTNLSDYIPKKLELFVWLV